MSEGANLVYGRSEAKGDGMTRGRIILALVVVASAATLAAACQPDEKSETPSAETAPDTSAERPQDAADPPVDDDRPAMPESSLPQKGSYAPPSEYPVQVYFGDPHVHTSISLDAAAWGNRLGPEGAYRFARGEAVTSFKGWTAKLTRPLDFLVVADHTDGYGFYTRIEAGEPFVVSKPEGKRWHELLKKGDNRTVSDEIIKMFSQGTLPWDITSKEMLGPGWEETIAAAEKYNDPGKFTAFIGYEWTSLPNGNNVHRVIVYRDGGDKARQTLPFTQTESQDPEDLWKVLKAYEEKTGGKLLAIPHNGNWSNGLMFADVAQTSKKPLDKSYVTTRKRWEPLYEATQIKGDGEAHPFLSADDEFADYETWDLGNLDYSEAKTNDMLPHEYARSGLKLGLNYQERFGVNPFQFGLVGAGDSHTSLPGQEENNFFGKHSSSEPDPDRWKTPFRVSKIGTTEGWQEVASGLTGIWATENTRAALWDAMKRRETYATTGTRILVRMFGGWNFQIGDEERADYVALGYRNGVPMGGELHRAKKGKGPTFIVVATRDPMGANLDRVQMIKGWRDKQGKLHEKVYNIAWGDAEKREVDADGKIPAVGDTVNVAEATWTNSIDPDFDRSEHAFYYVRVLEIPTPRWTAYDAKRFGITMDKKVPMTTQERAYTSPIWYTP
jgi:hypothetical protein